MNARIHTAAVVVSMFVMSQQAHAQAEVTELEGTWERVSYFLLEGKQIEPTSGVTLLSFEGNNTSWQSFIGWPEATFSVDSSAMPAEIDTEDENSNGALYGIYRIKDDRLMLCFCIPHLFEPGIRPDRFESSEDYPTYLIVYRRVTEEDNE